MSTPPRVVALAPASPAAEAGVLVGDEILAVSGQQPRDILEWQWLIDEADPSLDIERGGLQLQIEVDKTAGEPLGIEVHAALFDQVRTCDNHCEFCFIYQLPPGMRKSLSLKDDDYRLSFLYGNFTTLTRFTEVDLERVIMEKLSPLYVSIHATDPAVRSDMLSNRRGGTSLRWLRALLDEGIEVHGQIVCCPGLNDGAVLEDTLCGVLDRYPELASVAVVPLGISDHSNGPRMRPHTVAEATATIDLIAEWQERFLEIVGHRLVFAGDEYYLLAEQPFPEAEVYGDFPMHEDGIGMARRFELEFEELVDDARHPEAGFFASVDGAPAAGYRAPRLVLPSSTIARKPAADAPVGILTGPYGARVLAPIVAGLDRDDVRIVTVENRFFGGNIGVTGLMVGADLVRTLADQPSGHRYLLPDVCLSEDRFLDDLTLDDLPRAVEVLPTDGHALREALAS